jgi:hypothetical protein
MPYSLPKSTREESSIRLAVKAELLDADNPIDYLVILCLEGKRYDGNWDGDNEQVARWAVAQWCQELGWAPDLTDYDAGEQVARGDELPCCDAVFYGDREDSDE